MNDKVAAGELCSRVVTIAYPSTAINEAARLMRERHVGSSWWCRRCPPSRPWWSEY